MARTCDLLLTNATVLTIDRDFTIYPASGVAITGTGITAVGPDALTYAAGESIDCRGRVVMPGLVNAHTHAPMTLLRGLADDLRLDVWLMGYMKPVPAGSFVVHYGQEMHYDGAKDEECILEIVGMGPANAPPAAR